MGGEPKPIKWTGYFSKYDVMYHMTPPPPLVMPGQRNPPSPPPA